MSDPRRYNVRSYRLHPAPLVKDLRTAVERTDVEAVLGGDLDEFLEAAIRQGLPFRAGPYAPVLENA